MTAWELQEKINFSHLPRTPSPPCFPPQQQHSQTPWVSNAIWHSFKHFVPWSMLSMLSVWIHISFPSAKIAYAAFFVTLLKTQILENQQVIALLSWIQ